MKYEVRFYADRNMDFDYYTGNDDVVCRMKAEDKHQMLWKLREALKQHEGKTYSFWIDGDMWVGGACDPTDYDVIKNLLILH